LEAVVGRRYGDTEEQPEEDAQPEEDCGPPNHGGPKRPRHPGLPRGGPAEPRRPSITTSTTRAPPWALRPHPIRGGAGPSARMTVAGGRAGRNLSKDIFLYIVGYISGERPQVSADPPTRRPPPAARRLGQGWARRKESAGGVRGGGRPGCQGTPGRPAYALSRSDEVCQGDSPS